MASRAWLQNTAPPIATDGLLLTTNEMTRRGSGGVRRAGIGGAIVVGGLMAIAVIALDNDGS
ncbi:MAG: hypothetical protein VB878_09400 [Pirellulaceae bacterium]